jgi:competence protein ComEC
MNKLSKQILIVLILINALAWIAVFSLNDNGLIKVVFFDVGQGDSAFIETPGQNQILIDGGPNAGVLEKLGKEMPFWDRTIDLIILSHPDYDHISGLIEILKKYEVENVLWTGALKDSAEVAEWQKLIKEEGSNIIIAKAGQRISGKGLAIEILYPFEDISGQTPKDTNQTSIVLKLSYGEKSFLFTGDTYKSQEYDLLEKGADIDSDVLKVAHHGSKTSSGEEFIKAVSPEIALIPVGEGNSYGHPNQEVLDILNGYGIKILRTDENKDVMIYSDGKELIINHQ